MPNNIAHFSIHADDLPRAMRFYENVFGWTFTAWGPPGFFLITTGTKDDPGIGGALQQRTKPVVGDGVIGFECTVGIDNIDETQAKVEANGGTIIYQKFTIPTVGTLIQFKDTEGNILCAMQYEPGHRG
jgi:predicted enzyme related to lactoylglutathione lyase